MPKKALIALLCIAVLAIALLASVVTWADIQARNVDGLTKLATLGVAPIAALMAAAASFWVAERQARTSKDIEFLKGDLERLKARMSAERVAYDEMYAAACTFYYALSPLEIGRFDKKSAQEADDAMVVARRYWISIDAADKGHWMVFWQGCRNMRVDAEAMTSSAQWTKLWGDDMTKVSTPFLEFEKAAISKLNPSPAQAEKPLGG